MIVYNTNYFGLPQIFRLNGSALYRTLLPSTFSTCILILYKYTWGEGDTAVQLMDDRIVEGYPSDYSGLAGGTLHPFVIAIYVMAFSLIMNHRLNYCYQRYWESCSNLYLMTSKWVDSATTLASFHYQSSVYDENRPACFGTDHSNTTTTTTSNNSTTTNTNTQARAPPSGGNTRTSQYVNENVSNTNYYRMSTIADDEDDDEDDNDHGYDETDVSSSWSSNSSSSQSSQVQSSQVQPQSVSVSSSLRRKEGSDGSGIIVASCKSLVSSFSRERRRTNSKVGIKEEEVVPSSANNDAAAPPYLERISTSRTIDVGSVCDNKLVANDSTTTTTNDNNNNNNSITNHRILRRLFHWKFNKSSTKSNNNDSNNKNSGNRTSYTTSSSVKKNNENQTSSSSSLFFKDTTKENKNNVEQDNAHVIIPDCSGGSSSGSSGVDNKKVQLHKSNSEPVLVVKQQKQNDAIPPLTTASSPKNHHTVGVSFADVVKGNSNINNNGSKNSLDNGVVIDDNDSVQKSSSTGKLRQLAQQRKTLKKSLSSKFGRRSDYSSSYNTRTTNNRPYTHNAPKQSSHGHRRKPSTDMPNNTVVIKSFTPNPSLAWQKRNRVAMPRNTGLHSSMCEHANLNWEKLLLDDKRRRIEEERRKKMKEQRGYDNDDNTAGGGISGMMNRRASLPVMNLKRSALLLGQSTIHRGEKRISSDPLDKEWSSENEGSINIDDNNNDLSNISSGSGGRTKSISYSNKLLKPPLNWLPPIVDLPSLHKKQSSSIGSSCMSSNGTKSSFSNTSDQHSSNIRFNVSGSGHLNPPEEDMNGRASLFLQEAAHLFSLVSAVAMASLRADMEGCASPLVDYLPGQEFPPVNPDEMEMKILINDNVKLSGNSKIGVDKENLATSMEDDDDLSVNSSINYANTKARTSDGSASGRIKKKESQQSIFSLSYHGMAEDFGQTVRIKRNNSCMNVCMFLFGLSRTARERTIYNASRPFSVLGGVSNQEVEMLRKVRGHAAQHALCTFWLREFITREHLSGGTGSIAPPIMARVYQYLSDGTQAYHQCRKTAFTDFPFPHAQLTSFFAIMNIFVFPLLYYLYVTNFGVAIVLNFLTNSCFVGMQEVAMELEEPFIRYPNDIPLNNYQAQFNEALISSLYAGFHPDAWGYTSDNDGIFPTTIDSNSGSSSCEVGRKVSNDDNSTP